MDLPNYFEKFLREIRLTTNQNNDLQRGHSTLRERLECDERLKSLMVGNFLQGSYKRGTAVRPNGDKRADIDVVVVTKIDKEKYPNPDDAMNLFLPFLDEHYKGKHKKQGRSFGIELTYVDLDLVITSAPSAVEEEVYHSAAVTAYDTLEDAVDWRLIKSWQPLSKRASGDEKSFAEAMRKEKEWQTEPLWIPDREIKDWRRTHPLEQIKWTAGKNTRCNGHYVNVVKAIKWWQLTNYGNDRPKSYPLEHLIGICCPDFIMSIAQCVTQTFEAIRNNYAVDVANNRVPILQDHGVPEHNVFARITVEEFHEFYNHVVVAAKIAREALDSNKVSVSAEKWRELFGDKFPPADNDDSGKGEPKGPFIAPPPKSQTGDMTPRRYGNGL